MNPFAIRSVLVATDLGDGSEVVLRGAAELARHTGAVLHLIHAADVPVGWHRAGDSLATERNQELNGIRAELDRQARRWLAGVEVGSAGVHYGPASRVIRRWAAETRANLVLIGPHRAETLGTLLLGSTLEQTLRAASVPCLTMRAELSLPLRRILVPVNLDAPAGGALDLAFAYARVLGVESTEVHVLHVVSPEGSDRSLLGRELLAMPRLRREVDRAVQRDPLSARLTIRPDVIPAPTAAEGILAYAEAVGADLVVQATHAYGALTRTVMRSVSGTVVRRIGCPVVLVPPALWGAPAEPAALEVPLAV